MQAARMQRRRPSTASQRNVAVLLPRPLDVLALQQPQLPDEPLPRLAGPNDVVQKAVTGGTKRRVELTLIRAHLLQATNA